MFLDVKTRIGNRYGRTDGTTLGRIGEIYNDVLQFIYNEIGYSDQVEGAITTVSGRMSYPLEPYLNPVNSLMLIPSQNKRIHWVTRDEFEGVPDHTNSGVPTRYTIVENNSVREQPSSQIKVKSTSSGDTTQTVTIRGISHHQYVSETLTLNGTSDVTSTEYYTELIEAPSLSAAAAGDVTVKSNNNGVTNATISASALAPTATVVNPGAKIVFVSSMSGDTQKVTVEGQIIDTTNGYSKIPYKEDKALTGQTIMETDNRFTRVFSISLASAALGTIRVTTSNIESSPADLGVISPGRMTMDHQIVSFDPVPDGSYGIRYRASRNPSRLSNDADRPQLDERAWPVIEKWAEAVFNDWKGDRRGIGMIMGLPAFKEDMKGLQRLMGQNVQARVRKGQNAFPLGTSHRRSSYHLDPNIYGPA